MIQLLFPLIFAEATVIVMFVFKTPLRKLVIMGLDRAKRARAPIVFKTVGATFFAVMMSSVYNVVKIHNRWIDDGEVNPTDQVLLSKHLLEASIIGFSLFLGLMIDRLHHYTRELCTCRKSVETIKRQNRVSEDGKTETSQEIKALVEELNAFKEKAKQLEKELQTKMKEAENAQAKTVALGRQSEGLLLEYDRVLEDNQNLQNQLRTLDRRLSYSGSKM